MTVEFAQVVPVPGACPANWQAILSMGSDNGNAASQQAELVRALQADRVQPLSYMVSVWDSNPWAMVF